MEVLEVFVIKLLVSMDFLKTAYYYSKNILRSKIYVTMIFFVSHVERV